MPTPSEQKALAFIAIVALLGGAVRVVRANSAPAPTSQQQQALARQASAAETAAVRDRAKKSGRGRKMKLSSDTTPNVIGGVSAVTRFGYPVPGPRIDTDSRAARLPGATTPASTHVDLDVATAEEIEKLPRIGPAMAKKIVANRDSLGPFRDLQTLGRVKGMGPATLKLLGDHVSFSGRRAPFR